MNIYYKEKNNEDITLNIALKNNIITADINGNSTKDFNLNEIFSYYSEGENDFICSIYGSKDIGFDSIYKYRVTRPNERDLIKNLHFNKEIEVIFQIYFSGKDSVALVVPNCVLGKVTNINKVLCTKSSPYIQAQKEFPSYVERSTNLEKKKKLLLKLDCNDSLSGNECQIDILTKIVEVLASKFPSDVKSAFPKYEEFFKDVKDTSVLTVKSADTCLSDMVKQKTKIRNAQKEYFSDEQ